MPRPSDTGPAAHADCRAAVCTHPQTGLYPKVQGHRYQPHALSSALLTMPASSASPELSAM
eukprot:6095947-Alexandrium_andersonii.AAC.1